MKINEKGRQCDKKTNRSSIAQATPQFRQIDYCFLSPLHTSYLCPLEYHHIRTAVSGWNYWMYQQTGFERREEVVGVRMTMISEVIER